MARDEGWLAEHMLILKLTSPEGKVKYVSGAFPSASGKTNLAMLIPKLEGWTVETVGDDIAWMKFGEDGRLYAVNPEAGFFGVAPGTEPQDQPERDGDDREEHDLHQLRPDRRRRRLVGGHDRRAAGACDRLEGQRVDARLRRAGRAPERALHHPGRAVPLHRARSGRTPPGVPIDAFLFGGRRATVVPLVTEAFDWEHGVFLGATMSVEKTAAADGAVGELRFDPMAMLPFCGYNMADYFGHWLEVGRSATARSCRRSSSSTGSARTTRATSSGPASARTSASSSGSSAAATARARPSTPPIGRVPAEGEIDTEGTTVSDEDMRLLLEVDPEAVRAQLPQVEEHLARFGDRLPDAAAGAARGAQGALG